MDDQLEEILKSLVNKVKESQEYKEYRRMRSLPFAGLCSISITA